MVLTEQERLAVGRGRAAFRVFRKLSQEEVAERASESLGDTVSVKAVIAAEAGRSVDDWKLRAIAMALGISFVRYADPPDFVGSDEEGSSRESSTPAGASR